MSAKQRNKGFTLIELVVVIAILAILAAFALPRFAQLSEQAHRSSIKGTAGALAAGVALATIREVSPSVTVEQIQSAAKRYKEKFTSAPTAFALAKWWGSLQVPEPKSAYPSYSIGAPLTPEQKAEEEARANAMREFLRANSTTT